MIASGESETLEFKSTTGARREAAATVCAMLNQHGGRVVFGVTSDGALVGQQVSERTIEELSAELARISPATFPTVERLPIGGDRDLVVIEVSPGDARPYQYRGTGYRRVGNTTLAMLADEYNRMLLERLHSEQRWENQPAVGWSVADLDTSEILRTVDEAIRRGRLADPGTRDPMDLLRGLGLCRDGELWRAAVALFGNEDRIEFEMPQCRIRVARFRGFDRMEFLDNRQHCGNAFALLRASERFLRDTLPIAGRFEPGRMDRIDEPLYPTLATREALANALCHRDYTIGGGSIGVAVYDDRLEISSPGTLHFGLTPEKLFETHNSRPWNPLIARTFYRRGLIEEWGRGTLKMVEETASAGLPRPEIEDDGGTVTVCFRRGEGAASMARPGTVTDRSTDGSAGRSDRQHLNARLLAILDLLERAGQPLALREIRAGLNEQVDERRLRDDLAELKAKRLIVLAGRGRGARWTRR